MAVQKWKKEPEHKNRINVETLGANSPVLYLENRLDRAFHAGWAAAARHYEKLIKDGK